MFLWLNDSWVSPLFYTRFVQFTSSTRHTQGPTEERCFSQDIHVSLVCVAVVVTPEHCCC